MLLSFLWPALRLSNEFPARSLSDVEELRIPANALNSHPVIDVLFYEHTVSRPIWQLLHDGAKHLDDYAHLSRVLHGVVI